MPRPRLALTSLALAAFLAGPTAAAPHPARANRREPPKAEAVLVSRLLGFLTNVFGKNGGSLDPFGVPAPTVQPNPPGSPAAGGESADNGSSLDPFGGH
jgi:hypothetical protein